MAITSVDQTIAAVEVLALRVDTIVGSVDPTQIAPEDAQAVRAGLAGVRADGRTLLRELDTTHEEDLAIIEDGSVVIALWKWRHETRRDVMALLGQARTVQDLCESFVTGEKKKVIVSREGDTLQRIAARELGDWREWPRLLQANPSVPAGALASGTSLIVPEKR